MSERFQKKYVTRTHCSWGAQYLPMRSAQTKSVWSVVMDNLERITKSWEKLSWIRETICTNKMIFNLFLHMSRSSESYVCHPRVTFSCPTSINQNVEEWKKKKRFMLFPYHYPQTSGNLLSFQRFAPIMYNLPCWLSSFELLWQNTKD